MSTVQNDDCVGGVRVHDLGLAEDWFFMAGCTEIVPRLARCDAASRRDPDHLAGEPSTSRKDRDCSRVRLVVHWGMTSTTSLGRIASILVLACGIALAPSCGDDSDDGGNDVCKSCGEGQQCRTGPDGKDGCFCNPVGDTGCPEGLSCQNDAAGEPACYCSPVNNTGCEVGLVCENVVGGTPDCFTPVTLGGRVFDLATEAPIEGAVVVARDANNAAASGLAVTDATGHYDLAVPTPRNGDGTLARHEIFLRADAAGYVTFPTAPRVALPIDMSNASGEPLHLETSATDVGMIELPNSAGLGTIKGTVLAKNPGGTLVVAGGATVTGGGATGIADYDGTYTVFNVPAGNVAVHGYKIGLQLEPATADVSGGAVTEFVDLADLGEATAVVSGKVEIVNPGNGKDTSVILAVDETFVESAARGEMPPGLRAYPVAGDFTIGGVPDGNYVVLAAFENDFLVRDPDTSIGGTDLVRISVEGGDLAIPESFKVTGALDVVSPDREEVVTGTPDLVWNDDSGEDHYEIRVFDAFGTLVWEDTAIPGVSGGGIVSVPYGGPALQPGMLYQFRATSIKNGGTPLAITEDLRGVFLYQ